MKLSESLQNLKSYIVYYPEIAKMLGGVKEAIFLLNLVGWYDGKEIYKRRKEIYEETGLSLKEQDSARKRLKDLGILKERHAKLEHLLYFAIDLEKLDEMYNNYTNTGISGNDKREFRETTKSDFGKRQKGVSLYSTYSTTDTTTYKKYKKSDGDNKRQSKKEQKITIPKSKILVVFCYWKEIFNHKRAKLDDKREKIIKQAFKTGYTEEELKQAIDGCKKSEWHMGGNERGITYDEISMILRDANHIDRFIGIVNGEYRKKEGLIVKNENGEYVYV